MISALERIIRGAGDILLSSQNAQVMSKEGHFNFVTQTDLQVQTFLIDKLLALLPGSKVFSEEQENQQLDDEPTWVVDPIDGTINFIRGRECSAISVALLQGGEPQVGMIFDPYRDELYAAHKGTGAKLNGKPITVSYQPMDQAVVAFGTSPYAADLAKKGMQAAHELLRRCGDLRRSGSAALDLASIACGRADIFFELQLSPWDYAAGVLLVQEAGGRVHQPGHDNLRFDRVGPMVAANPQCFVGASQVVQAALKGELQL